MIIWKKGLKLKNNATAGEPCHVEVHRDRFEAAGQFQLFLPPTDEVAGR